MAAAVDAYARSRGIEIADRLDFSRPRRLLDLRVQSGTYSLAIVERKPEHSGYPCGLAGSHRRSRRLAAARKMGDRLEFIAADAMHYNPDQPFDTVLISNALHMIGPAESIELLKHVFPLLLPGGRLIVQAQYLHDDRVSPRWPTLLSLMLRVATPNGRNHAISETKQWMEQAGFRDVHHVRFSVWNVCSCLLGERPASC
jgi:trans-aconitate methyltransferase